jgi:hypothetical protein
LSTAPTTRRSGGHSKKLSHDPSAAMFGHSAEGEQRVGSCDGSTVVYTGRAIPTARWFVRARDDLRLDETSRQLLAEMRGPIPMKAGRPVRFHCEHERN